MSSIRQLAKTSVVAVGLCLSLSGTVMAQAGSAEEHARNVLAWKEYEAAQRQQIGELLDLWLPTWRPSRVGRTYLDLAERCVNMNVDECSTELRKHISKAGRIYARIAGIYAQGPTSSDIEMAVSISKGGGIKTRIGSSSDVSEKGREILESMRGLVVSEEAVILLLKLDE